MDKFTMVEQRGSITRDDEPIGFSYVDVMWGHIKLAEASSKDDCQFEDPISLNEMAQPGDPVVTWATIHEAAAWARTRGYRTYTSVEGWKNP